MNCFFFLLFLDYDYSKVPLYYPGEHLQTHIIPDQSQTYKPPEIPVGISEYTTAPPVVIEEVTVTEAPSTITQRKPTVTPTSKPLPIQPKPRPSLPVATKPPKKDEQCKLPIVPDLDKKDFSSGFRFGTKPHSRLEAAMKTHRRYDIMLEMKTSYHDGLLYYASDAQHDDFFALYIRHGQVRIFSFVEQISLFLFSFLPKIKLNISFFLLVVKTP